MYTIDTHKLYVFKVEKCDLLLHRLAEKKCAKIQRKKLGERDIWTNTQATYIQKTESKI